jgi:Flp pilus assembly protein TadG
MFGRVQQDDRGAAAVEFALVSVLLFTLLFGIIQYGFLFFQYQAAAATAHEAARLAAVGLYPSTTGSPPTPACPSFGLTVAGNGEANGLPLDSVRKVTVAWSPDPAQRGGLANVEVTVRPTRLGAAFVPVPHTFTVKAVGTVEDIGLVTTTCSWDAPPP